MLPFTYAPRLPNIGFTTTSGRSGTSARNRALSSSVILGISTYNLRYEPTDALPQQTVVHGMARAVDERDVTRL